MADIYISVGQSIKSETGNFYKILEFLGNGANAFAYRCLCTSGDNRGIEFVLKIQYNLSTEVRRDRFLRESAFLNSHSHPAILAQYDYGFFKTAKNTFPFIVTNYMPETLAKRMATTEIPFESKIKYACQLLSAIIFLQNQNIVHRDIKPSNIFISNDNVVLGDFGLIKQIEPTISENEDDIELVNETVMNTLSGYVAMAKFYRTPELVHYANRTDVLRKESDVFQLGLVLAELFAGKNPLKPVTDLRAPIELDPLPYFPVPRHGGIIASTIRNMLILDPQRRITANLALDRFTNILTA